MSFLRPIGKGSGLFLKSRSFPSRSSAMYRISRSESSSQSFSHSSSDLKAQGASLAEMTAADCDLMNTAFSQIASSEKLAQRMISMLTDQKGLDLGCQVDLYDHGLQTATRCFDHLLNKQEGLASDMDVTPSGLTPEDEELVVVALLHDVGETLSPINHGEIAASLLRPYISPKSYWILMHHEIFQLYYYGEAAGAKDHELREQLRHSPYFDACEEFCLKYDQIAFDGTYKSRDLEFFTPMIHRLLEKPVYGHPEHKGELVNRLKAGCASGYPEKVAE